MKETLVILFIHIFCSLKATRMMATSTCWVKHQNLLSGNYGKL